MKKYLIPLLVGFLLCNSLWANDSKTKPKIAVFEFGTIDILGEKFYDFTDRKGDSSMQNSLSNEELMVIDIEMLGYVKMIDAKSEAERRRHERRRLDMENDRNLKRYYELADSILKSNRRSVIIGSEYMVAALGRCENVEVVDSDNIAKAFRDLEFNRAGGVTEAKMEKFSQITGATHMLYAVVADMQVNNHKFKAYGVETENRTYTLDLIVKLVDLESNKIVFSTLVTGKDRQLKTAFGESVNSDRFKDLMSSAIEKAAEEIDMKFEEKVEE